VAAICIAGAGDLPAILDLWKRAGTEPGHTDDIESLTKLIAHDPGALLVAVEDETIAGSVIAAWDGWRGSIYRLAVAPSHQRRGLGTVLVNAAVKRLRALGAVRLQAPGWRRSAAPGRARTGTGGPGGPWPRPKVARLPSAACDSRADAAGRETGARAGRSTAAASDAPSGHPAAPGRPPGTPARHRTAAWAGHGRAGPMGSRGRRSPRTVRSGGCPGLASQPIMDALLPCLDQPGTPYRPQ